MSYVIHSSNNEIICRIICFEGIQILPQTNVFGMEKKILKLGKSSFLTPDKKKLMQVVYMYILSVSK
jgi:hypothetical protein